MKRIPRVLNFMESGMASFRATRIENRLWGYVGAMTDGADPHRLFGYTAPLYFSHEDVWAFFFCPEQIEQTTECLDDEEFGEWLRYIRAHITTHTTVDWDEEAVDRAVFLVMPETRDLVARVFDSVFV